MIEKIYKIFERLADIGSDKYLHFIVGMILATIVRKENFDLTDALAGVMGGALMLILMI